MKPIFSTTAALLLLLFSAFGSGIAQAGGHHDCNRDGLHPECEAYRSGNLARAGKSIPCLVHLSGPTIPGKVTYDVRDATGQTRFKNPSGQPAPRRARVRDGYFETKFGCPYLEQPTDVVYMCVEGFDGHQYWWIITRSSGLLDEARQTHELQGCLLGPDCGAGYTPGSH